MSGIQILNTLSNHTSSMAQAVPDTCGNDRSNCSADENDADVSMRNTDETPPPVIDPNTADWQIDLAAFLYCISEK